MIRIKYMMEKLEKLRAKPYHVKRMISASIAGGVTLVIALFWVVSLSVTGNSSSNLADSASAQIAASPFSTLSASVVDSFAPITAALGHLKSVITGTASDASSSNAIQMYSPAQAVQMDTVNQSSNNQ